MSQRQRTGGDLPTKPRRNTGAVGYLTALGAAIACGVLALGALILLEARNDAWEQAKQASVNLTIALEREIARNIDVIDLSLRSADDAMQQPGLYDTTPELRRRALFGASLSAKYLGSMSIVDASGAAVETALGSPATIPNLAMRDFFRVHQEQPDVGLFISRPYASRNRESDPSVAFSRRRSSPDGKFQGVVVAALRLAYFQDMFTIFNLGANGMVALVDGMGRQLTRHPSLPLRTGIDITTTMIGLAVQKKTTGFIIEKSPFDNVMRIVVFRKIGNYPLFVIVGTSVDEIYAAWRHKAVVIGSLLIGFCISTIALCLMFRREMIRRLDSEQALAKAAEELSIIASTDALTGLSNRRALEARFLEEWRRAIRMQTPIGLLMVDADHFKLYNDSQGHQAGDQVLQSIAACIKRNIGRAGDVAARYGGEEFVVVLPGVDIAGALQVSEHIRHDVEALDIPHASNPDWRITVSIGVAVTVPTLNDSGSNLLKKADEALYKAKRAGRNRVQVADNQVPEVAADLRTRFAR